MSVANAALIAADSFLRGAATTSPGDPAAGEYDARTIPANVNLLRRAETSGAGQNPTVAGFTGPWTGNVASTSNAVNQWTAAFDGTPHPGLTYPTGGRARFTGVDNLQRRVQRTLSDYAPSNTYYISLLSQALPDDTDRDGFVGIGFTNSSAGEGDAHFALGSTTMRGVLVGIAGDGANTDYVVRHQGAAGVTNGVILDNVPGGNSAPTRFTVVKLEFNDNPDNSAGNSRISVWQDPSDVSSEAAAGAPLVFRTFALGSNADLTQMTFVGIDYSRAVSFDEPRLATTWADAVGVPEPGSIAGVMALSGAALARRRRRLRA